jgi:peptidoglycan/xylan/chitin deacetylase (PgdA/CDA1 family)
MTLQLKKKLKTLLGRAARIGGAYSWDFRSKMAIVAFHRVSDQLAEDGLTCSSAKFEAFCEFFRAHFKVIPLSEQIARCSAGKGVGGTLSITFDDGYLDNFEVAAPILGKLKLPAAFFVTTGFIGTSNPAAWDRHLAQHPGWMTWDQVRSLAAQGFEIGSHTDTHINLGKVDPAVARAELRLSREKLQQELGTRPRLFAYPFGGREHISERSRELVREAGFECCIACHGGVNSGSPDPFNLNRIGIAEWFGTPDQFGFELLTGRA